MTSPSRTLSRRVPLADRHGAAAVSQDVESARTVLAIVSPPYEAMTGNPPIWAYRVHEADAVPAPDASRRPPWLRLPADFEGRRLRPEIDWKWVARRMKPYAERIDWLRDLGAEFSAVDSVCNAAV